MKKKKKKKKKIHAKPAALFLKQYKILTSRVKSSIGLRLQIKQAMGIR
jgi:hypothetical protein